MLYRVSLGHWQERQGHCACPLGPLCSPTVSGSTHTTSDLSMICKAWAATPSHDNDRLTSLQVSVTHSCECGRAGEMLSPVKCILGKHKNPSLEPWHLQEVSKGRGDSFKMIFRVHLPASLADW